MVQPLLSCLHDVTERAEWKISRMPDVPTCEEKADSGVHLCIIILAFAIHAKKWSYVEQNFYHVFTYTPDKQLLKKAREFIGRIAYNKLKENKWVHATSFVNEKK